MKLQEVLIERGQRLERLRLERLKGGAGSSTSSSSKKGGRPRGAWGYRGECRAVTLRLPPSMLDAVKEMARQGAVTQATVFHYLLYYALSRHGWLEGGLFSPLPVRREKAVE